MKILNPQLAKDIEHSIPLKLDLGGGLAARDGFYAVDKLALKGTDMVADLNEPLELLPDNCAEYIYSRHTFEHIQNLLPLLQELHRITKKKGLIEIIVPHFSNPYFYSDPTHVRFFGLYSMYYFVDTKNQPAIRKVPSFYSGVRFEIESIRIEFYRLSWLDKLLAPILYKVINRNIHWQNFYERKLSSWFHASEIKYLMRPEK